MKKLIIFILLLIIFFNSQAQHVPNIQFIHIGPELKPIGSLLISIKKHILPTVRSSDLKYGIGIKTNKKTFEVVKNFVVTCAYLKKDTAALHGYPDYEIIESGGFTLLLGIDDKNRFFTELVESLQIKHLDQDVITALARYIHYN
jgi:hypothetical protein